MEMKIFVGHCGKTKEMMMIERMAFEYQKECLGKMRHEKRTMEIQV